MLDRRRDRVDEVLNRRQPDLTILTENLHKPRNFSAIVRTADAVGIHEVNVVPGEMHPRRHWRTSSGTEKWMQLRIHADIKSACSILHAEKFQIVAANLTDDALDFREVDYTRPTALLLGTELFGVSDTAAQLADQQVRVPMEGMSQSLNVSVACALVLYEAQRQRTEAGLYEQPRLDAAIRARLRFEWLHPQLTAFCRKKGIPYPELDEAGEVIGKFPRA